MGLDITAYRRLSAIRPAEEDDDLITFYVNPDFPGRAAGLEADMAFDARDSFGFRAGSYSGYNQWREWLASLVGTTPRRVWDGEQPAAFGDLIHFSDCEGTIGPVVAARLAKDFATYEGAASLNGDRYHIELYRDFKRAFEMAADGGAVSFH